MIKLCRARSLLYRRQILQVNMRLKARDEIYKIYMLLHRSDLNILAIFIKHFRIFQKLQNLKFRHFQIIFIKICSDFDENVSEFRHFHFHITIFKQILKPNIVKNVEHP